MSTEGRPSPPRRQHDGPAHHEDHEDHEQQHTPDVPQMTRSALRDYAGE